MRGSIVKRSENSYSIIIDLGKDPVTGKRKQSWTTVKGHKREAERRLSELLHQQDTGTFTKPTKLTVGQYLTDWLQDTAYPNVSPRTYESYEYAVKKYISPAIGQTPLDGLKPQHLQKLYAEKQATGRHRTAEYIHITMRIALQAAVRTGLIVRNPADMVERPKVAKHEMRTMAESDISLFLEAAKATPYYSLFYLALFTGLRRSEILALRWCDVDLLLCQLSVTRTIHVLRYGTYKGQTVFKQPKTAKGRRLIALSPSTVAVLTEHRLQQETLQQELGLPPLTDDRLVFCDYDGKPYLPDSISHAWLKLSRRCGVNIRFHDARHTHASLMLKQGVHPKIVQERLGHHSVEITLDTYSHVAPGLQQAAANRFDQVVDKVGAGEL